MNFDQLANLIKAGFNEEQIRNIGSIMDTGTGTGTNTPTSTPTPTPTPTDNPGGAPATPPTPATPPAEPGPSSTDKAGESETVSLLKEMLGIIQRGNINTVGTGGVQEQTGVDVLAEILNPTPKTK